MKRVRFAPSPTGTLHIGSALSAVANRGFGDWMLLRIDNAVVPGGEEAIVEDLRWLGIEWDDFVRQSERGERYREAAERLAVSATHELASVVDDIDFGITHVICGNDEPLHANLVRALGAEPPEYVHHGLILGEATVASLRDAGIPGEAVRTYLEELGLPARDVQLDLPRVRRLAIEAIEAMSDQELAACAGVDPQYVPVMRGARDLVEARRYADELAYAEIGPTDDPETLVRFKELVELPPADLRRELKAAGGNLHALRLALTGRDKGPELSAILAALPKEEALRRVDQALQHAQP